MKNGSELPVLIVGGGVGGLTLAIALSKKNISSIVFEQAQKFSEVGAAIQLLPNAYKALHYLNITPAIKNIISHPERLMYMDGITGRPFLKIDLGETIVKHFNHPYIIIHRADLIDALVGQCHNNSFIKLVTNAKVNFIEEENNAVTVFTENGGGYQGGALVGCDGVNSFSRIIVCGSQKPRFSGIIGYRGLVDLDSVPEKYKAHQVVHWARDKAHLVHYPLFHRNQFNMIALLKTTEEQDLNNIEGNPHELLDAFKGSYPEIEKILPYINTSRRWLLFDRDPISKWTKGLITLLGDAAHPTLPHMTEGAAMAIEDAVVLANKLENARGDYYTAFEAYEKERYLRTAYVQLFSRVICEIYNLSGVARELRNQLFSEIKSEYVYAWLGKIYKGIDI